MIGLGDLSILTSADVTEEAVPSSSYLEVAQSASPVPLFTTRNNNDVTCGRAGIERILTRTLKASVNRVESVLSSAVAARLNGGGRRKGSRCIVSHKHTRKEGAVDRAGGDLMGDHTRLLELTCRL